MLFEYALPEFSILPFAKTVSAGPAVTPVETEPVIAAAAPAAPPITAPSTDKLMESGMMRSSPGTDAPLGAIGATPGATGESGRALPPITLKRPDQPDAAGQPKAGASMTRDALTSRQEELARKEQELRALETDISAKLEQMEILESRLQAMMRQAEDIEGAKFRHSVDMLSNMKSRQAAAVLTTLDERIAVKILAGMRGRMAGEILTFVEPQKAARLTESLIRMQMPLE